ncbi:hypothetical protein K501DRAFT_169500 [Backusella circina FSU 941]|nr:hypothetical protein K501DRAFT_169500 [Backusella circina FSU 941]
MIKPVRDIITVAENHQYYHSAYAANAKLLLGAVQMDKLVTDNIYADINITLREIASCLHIALTDINQGGHQDEFFDQAMFTLCKSIEIFRQSAGAFYDFVMKKAQKALKDQVEEKNPYKTPPRHKEIPSTENLGVWTNIIPQLTRVLVQCSVVLPPHLAILKKKNTTNTRQKRSVTYDTAMLSFIDIMTLLAKIQFDIDDEHTHEQAYDYLSTAEEVCADATFTGGYRWISAAYYTLGASMYTAKYYANAIYPLRKSCTLLEKDTQRISTDEGRLQLCKRYEILGNSCQKKDTFDESLRAYRLALKRIPIQSLQTFVQHAGTTCVASLVEKYPLVPKIMDRFIRTSVVEEQQPQNNIVYAFSLMNMASLTPIQTAIIYECELKIWNNLGKRMKLGKYQFDIIEKLLSVYDGTLYPIRRARVLLEKTRLERAQNKELTVVTKAALKTAIEAANLLNVEVTMCDFFFFYIYRCVCIHLFFCIQSYGNDGELLGYRRHYLALASSWVALCKRELNEEIEDAFSTSLQQWGILLRKIPTIFDTGKNAKL